MTDYDRDRGAYSPSGEAPLAFDAREARQGGGRPPFALIISALILLILVVALVLYYRSGVRRAGEPPVVGAPLGAMTSAAPASAQPEEEARGLQVYSAENGAAASSVPAPTFAPPPEQPLPRPAAPQAQAPAAPPAAAPELRPAAPAPAPAPEAAAPVGPPPAAVAPAEPKPKPEAAKPAKAEAAKPAAAGSGPFVQIGAVASPALADKAWNNVAKQLPADMAGRTKRVEPVTTAAGAKLYRALIGGFDSKADAQAFCAKLKAAGGACIVR